MAEDLRVALDALEADAAQWQRIAGELRGASTRAAAQHLDPAVFSFAGQAAAAAYESLRARLTRLLAQGAANADATADALVSCAAAYAADERAHVDHLRGIN